MTPSRHPDELAQVAALLARAGRYREAWEELAPGLSGPTARLLIVASGVRLELGDPEAALELAQRAVGAGGGATAHAVIGDIHRRCSRAGDAESAYRTALDLEPVHAAAMVNLARVLGAGARPRLAEAEELLIRALNAFPGLSAAHGNLATMKLEQGRAGEAVSGLFPAAVATGDPVLWRLLAMVAQYDDATPASMVATYHHRAEKLANPSVPTPRSPRGGRGDTRRITLGLLSPDFRDHPVPRFILPWLPKLPREAFRVIGLDLTGVGDATTAACRRVCDDWLDVSGMSDEAVTASIREKGVDVLIDLAGLTAGGRPDLLARAPAPVQFTAIGYPGDTGLGATLGSLGDAHTDPENPRAIMLGRCFLCYGPETHSVAGGAEASPVPTGGPVFASLNALSKVSPTTLMLWSRVLAAVPGSTLLVKSAALDDPSVADSLRSRAAGAGISPQRLVLAGRTRSHAEHLATYRGVHVALDTFPYHGTTTTCEALSMGVAVVSLVGDRHASRVGLSLLSAVGLPDLAVKTADEYAAIAADLATDRSRLERFRNELPARLRTGPLGDANGYAAAMAATLRRLTYAVAQ